MSNASRLRLGVLITLDADAQVPLVSVSVKLTSPAAYMPPINVPEPASLVLLGTALVGLGSVFRRRQHAA